MFFLTLTTHALIRLGESQAMEILNKHSKRFFYYPFHCFLFKHKRFDLLVFSSLLGENLGRMGLTIVAVLGITLFPLSLIQIVAGLIIFIFIALLVGIFVPRLWVNYSPEKALIFSLSFSSLFLFLSFPISFLFLQLSDYLSRTFEKSSGVDLIEEMKERIVQILRSADVKEKLNTSDEKLIEAVIKFKERIVREVMVPRVNLFCLPADKPIREGVKILVEEGYSRTPVYRETIDNMIGVLMFKDILELYMDCAEGKKDPLLLNAPIETLTKSAFYTPETKKASQLLQEFRTKQMHMAIVVDEYGGTEGVITIEDILEEIVGEIADEYDIDEESMFTTHPGGGYWIVDARMNILDAEEIFNITIPQDGDYDTIGGYIFHMVGSIPQKGLRIHRDDFDLEVLSSSERNIEKVKITPHVHLDK